MLLLTGESSGDFGYNKSVNVIVNLLFPKRCVGCRKFGSYLCDDCFAKISFAQKYFCGVCTRPSYNGLTHPKCNTRYSIDGIFPILNYHGLLKKILYQYKYNPNLSDLTGVLGDFLYEGIIQNEYLTGEIEKGDVIYIPVPLYPSRERRRGYNQSELLAKAVAKKFGIVGVGHALVRTKNTKPQFKLPKDARRDNIRGAFEVKNNVLIKGKTVFLIDDITTTGATLSECANVLKRADTKSVFGIALGHEEK